MFGLDVGLKISVKARSVGPFALPARHRFSLKESLLLLPDEHYHYPMMHSRLEFLLSLTSIPCPSQILHRQLELCFLDDHEYRVEMECPHFADDCVS